MDKVWMAVFCLLTVIEYASFYYIVFGRRPRRPGKWIAGLTASVLALLLACLCWQEWVMDFRRILLFLACALAMFSLFKVSFRENLKLFLFSFAVLMLLEGILDCIRRVFLALDTISGMNMYVTGVLLMIWGYHFLMGRKENQNIYRLSARLKVIAAVMVYILALLMNFISWFLIELSYGGPLKYLGLFVVGGSIAACILLFALIYYFNGTMNYSMQVEILERQNEQQREYFVQLLKKEQDTRQFRHDLIAELLEMKNYTEHGEYEKLKDYLKEMLGEVSAISERQYDVGNDIVNTIINYYFLPIRESSKITVKGYMAEEQKVSQRDLCILVSNLVKNAVEAVGKIQDSAREIHFEVQQGKRTLNVRVENVFEGEIVMKNGRPATTKQDRKNHGFGLMNVKAVVEKYNGTYICKVEKQRYAADVFLPA